MPQPPECQYNTTIRSFVRRQGRLTKSQNAALTHAWDHFGVPLTQDNIDLGALFTHAHPTYLEIGFGNGDALLQMANTSPDCHFLGVEVHRPGVGHLLHRLQAAPLNNVKLFNQDAIAVLQKLPPQTLSGVHIFFPDPWPKKKHHKRRLIQPWFVQLLVEKLHAHGYIHCATDWADYAQHIITVLQSTAELNDYSPVDHQRPAYRPNTKFEWRGKQRGHDIWDIIYARTSTPLFPTQ